MTTYVDSSALVAIYVPERFSNAARQSVRVTSHERPPSNFSLGAWICCTWLPREC
jgi:hypothetical protein